MSQANSVLTLSNHNMASQINTFLRQMASLQIHIALLYVTSSTNKTGGGGRGGVKSAFPIEYYFWTHGDFTNPRINRITNNTGHKNEVIFFDTIGLLTDNVVNLTVRVNPTKRESQRAKLERYFLECVS